MKNNINSQIAGETARLANEARVKELTSELFKQDLRLDEALDEVNRIRDFVGSPKHILGSDGTKHGEIAEHVEVGIRNARDILENIKPSGDVESWPRNHPVDYSLDDELYQSKFINGSTGNQSLKHALEHYNQYHDQYPNMKYHIPKDQYKVIENILNGGDTEELSEKSINAIIDKVNQLEELYGSDFNEFVKPGISTYAEVQKGVIHETLDGHEVNLSERNDQIVDDIHAEHQPSLDEAGDVAGAAALVVSGMTCAKIIYAKHQQGKNIFRGDYTKDDWKDLGVETIKGGVKGGITGTTIYGITNYTDISAPFAAAMVSATAGVAIYTKQYFENKITMEDFINNSMICCSESAMVGVGATIGQALIPIPYIGTILGSYATRFILNSLKDYKYSTKLTETLIKQMNIYEKDLNKITAIKEKEIKKVLKTLSNLTARAFDYNNNLSLVYDSIKLARVYGVDENKIIHSEDELDIYIMN